MKRCPICQHPNRAEIDLRLVEGHAAYGLAQEFGLPQSSMEQHRQRGHAARNINQAIISAGETGILAPIAQHAISTKAYRVGELQRLYDRVISEITSQEVGELNHRLVAVGIELLENASKEMGTWRPDGGKAAEATDKLAQSIVIHAAVEAKKALATRDSSQSRELSEAIDVTPDATE